MFSDETTQFWHSPWRLMVANYWTHRQKAGPTVLMDLLAQLLCHSIFKCRFRTQILSKATIDVIEKINEFLNVFWSGSN